jgi:hypothetical protein
MGDLTRKPTHPHSQRLAVLGMIKGHIYLILDPFASVIG